MRHGFRGGLETAVTLPGLTARSPVKSVGHSIGPPDLVVAYGVRWWATEVHIDVHQPVEDKETSWPWVGQFDYDCGAAATGTRWRGARRS